MSISHCRAVWPHHARPMRARSRRRSGGLLQCQLSSRPTCSGLKGDITTGAACASGGSGSASYTAAEAAGSRGLPEQPPLAAALCLGGQPMAAHARQLAAQQGLRALSMPAGEPAPFVHCQAVDTTINTASPADVAAILAGSISLHCQATRARIKTAKSTGMALAPCSTWWAQTQPLASYSVQQSQSPHTWASASARTLTQRLAACVQTSYTASIGA